MNITTYAKFDSIHGELRRLLNLAQESVHICVAWISVDIYGPILAGLIGRGIAVHLIINSDFRNDVDRMRLIPGLNIIPVRMRASGRFMHNKFCIIDDRTVVTGSYNWSRNAEGHFENITVIQNDLMLVKQFRHEFADLCEYHQRAIPLIRCGCGSQMVRLAIFGYESGHYSESTVGRWSVCVRNNHVHRHTERHEQYLYAQLGMPDHDPDLHEDAEATIEDLRATFAAERRHLARIQTYFDSPHVGVDAAGYVVCINASEYYKNYAAFPEFKIVLPWRSAYVRKLIPAELEEHSGEIDQIIDEHKPII